MHIAHGLTAIMGGKFQKQQTYDQKNIIITYRKTIG